MVRNGLAEVKQSNAALARVEGWLIVVSVRDPSVPRSQTLVSVGDPGVLLCAPLARPAPRRNPDPRGGPGVWTPSAGRREREGPTLSASSRGRSRSAGSREWDPSSARRARAPWEGPRHTRQDTAPESRAGHAEPTLPRQGQGRGPGAPRGPAGVGEKPARCPHCLAPAAGREGAHLRSPPGALAGRAARL